MNGKASPSRLAYRNDIPWKSPREIFPIFHLIEYRHNTQISLLPFNEDRGGPLMNVSMGDEKSPFYCDIVSF